MAGLTFLRHELEALAARGLRRSLRIVEGAQGARIRLDEREVVNFSSNNYLGLAADPRLAEASCAGARARGTGSGASRLIVGTQDEHDALETELAALHRRDAALLFNSGYHANVGTLSSLAGEGDVIVSDALNHASIIDGCRLSRARVLVYPHADVGRAAQLLEESRSARRRFIVSDAVFSMDGDCAPVEDLADLARRYDAALVLDEAHAAGVLGEAGRGLAASRGVEPDVHMATLGKAFGSFGAFVAGSRDLREFLLNRARSFVFTTALPVGVITASREAVRLTRGPDGTDRRARLRSHIGRVRDGLADLGLLVPRAGETPIFPVLVGDEGRAMACSERLLERGLYVQGIRPPTVPRGTSRLRIALMATHGDGDLDALFEALRDLRDDGLLGPASPDPAERG